jgi:ABC-type cobalamin/Fe3+-siderophores transport system ATPase subunit
VLSDVDLSIRPDGLFCLLGPKGVGKTTLFKTMRLLSLRGAVGPDRRRRCRVWLSPRFAKTVAYQLSIEKLQGSGAAADGLC